MAEKSGSAMRYIVGGALIAAAAVGVAVFVPRRKLAVVAEPLRALGQSPVAMAMAAWAAGLWAKATELQAPQFDDLRPFDEF